MFFLAIMDTHVKRRANYKISLKASKKRRLINVEKEVREQLMAIINRHLKNKALQRSRRIVNEAYEI